ncbi:PREDICTED: tetratricopeptide repeat protein 5-like [Papilio polytes]|uniref:tetratricopeptide repeat protein 5-like n=1 Tax=Papilio polytes TaxID=76194 RepID=UPI000675E50F|nr:PREDICTED: tetratricopeptide repeat protein 5-like [Papilio polytes]
MSADSDEKVAIENATKIIDRLTKEIEALYKFRDLFFENHPLEMATQRNIIVEDRKKLLVEKCETIDVDTQIPFSMRAQFLYLKGRCYNIGPAYEGKALQYLSKAVKLNPSLTAAWNELGECYWKNMNMKDAKASFEGALKNQRNRLSLRCLSVIIRQQNNDRIHHERVALLLNSVEMAKEAVALDIKDGMSWMVLGNAYLCQFFTVAQDPNTLKLCMSAYKQAWLDPVARGQPDLYFNKGVALKYEEIYDEALQNFVHATRLDPLWVQPQADCEKLTNYLKDTNELVHTRGKLKAKRLAHLVRSIDKKMLGVYSEGTFHTFGTRRDVTLTLCRLDELIAGENRGKVVLARVVGSIHNENSVPFTFAIVDESYMCVCVTVYNWADGRGAIIGDCVAIPEPYLTVHKHESDLTTYDFKSLRLNNPLLLLVNGKRVDKNQFASTCITTKIEIQ